MMHVISHFKQDKEIREKSQTNLQESGLKKDNNEELKAS